MIAVIDYKAGNLTSVMKALRAVEARVTLTEDPDVVRRAKKIVLPGVGHFAATSVLEASGLKGAIAERIAQGVPFLGICVGMQWLLQGSTEAPLQPGLGYFYGLCERFPEGSEKVPHVGWNNILIRTEPSSRLFAGMEREQNQLVYFTHSYFVPTKPYRLGPDGKNGVDAMAAVTTYPERQSFASAVEHENVMGVQFHPEKSGVTGLRILRNFVELPC
jgi:imidazole glycerol-phosphate synthase subunit HisH